MEDRHLMFDNIPSATKIDQKEEKNGSSLGKTIGVVGGAAFFASLGLALYNNHTQNERYKRNPRNITIQNDDSKQKKDS